MRKSFVGVFVAVILIAGSAAAEIGPGMAMFSMSVAYQTAKLQATGDNADGGSFNLGLDIFDRDKPISFWLALGWGQMTTQNQTQAGQVKRTIRTFPVFIGAKYWFGGGNTKAYLGAALGAWFATQDINIDGKDFGTENGEGGALSIPVGVAFSLSQGANINVGYVLNIMFDNSYIENNLIHAIGVGIGFSWGG